MVVSTWRSYLPRDVRSRVWETTKVGWHLGFTAFGGPPVHFKIVGNFFVCLYKLSIILTATCLKFNDKFVKKLQWIDEQLVSRVFCELMLAYVKLMMVSRSFKSYSVCLKLFLDRPARKCSTVSTSFTGVHSPL